MPRRCKQRNCRRLGGRRVFKPTGIPARELEAELMQLDEFEAIRLCDHEGMNQIEAAESMGISRGTVQRLLSSGRWKLAEALLNNKMIVLEGDFGDENALRGSIVPENAERPIPEDL